MSLTYSIMILAAVTDKPVHQWKVPNRCLWIIPQLPPSRRGRAIHIMALYCFQFSSISKRISKLSHSVLLMFHGARQPFWNRGCRTSIPDSVLKVNTERLSIILLLILDCCMRHLLPLWLIKNAAVVIIVLSTSPIPAHYDQTVNDTSSFREKLIAILCCCILF